jgi:hypothetical protein
VGERGLALELSAVSRVSMMINLHHGFSGASSLGKLLEGAPLPLVYYRASERGYLLATDVAVKNSAFRPMQAKNSLHSAEPIKFVHVLESTILKTRPRSCLLFLYLW